MKELSICMTHYNRKSQILNTLQSIQNQNVQKDLYEIIIVDDNSRVPLSYSDFSDFDLDIKLITIQTNNKWWFNPCIAFNAAINIINGKRVIIQNSECLHTTNIIEYVTQNLKDNEYIAFPTLALSMESTLKIDRNTSIPEIDTSNSMWYVHPTINPRLLNFCSAIHKTDLEKVGGFDNRFAEGISYDDDFFIHSLRKAGINLRIEGSQLAFHQWHESSWEGIGHLSRKNELIFNELIK
jgi:glycosyltransferase involved in cell wall biosynthesis